MFRFMVGMCITEDLTSHVVGFRVLGLGVLSLGLRCLGLSPTIGVITIGLRVLDFFRGTCLATGGIRASGLCHRREIPDIAKSLT